MKKFFSRLFLNDYVYCSIFVAALLWGVSNIPINHELIDPFSEALADFEITDLAFTELRVDKTEMDTTGNFISKYIDKLKQASPEADTNIVIVNTGYLERADLAIVIRNINECKPAVIGFNLILNRTEDSFGDSLLAETLNEVENIVYTSKLSGYDEKKKEYSQIEVCDSLFMKFEDSVGVKYAETGFKNMPTNEKDFKTTRHFYERAQINGVQENFFPVELIDFVNPDKVKKFMKRSNNYEVINYKGNLEKFFSIDAEQALNGEFEPDLIKGKIVILGFMGESIANEKFWDDYKYYTPLNKKYAGKTFPDMFETVIYANIASQILDENHVHVVSDRNNLIINLIICFLNVVIFSLLFHLAAVWWDAFSILITLIEMIVLMIVTALIFVLFQTQINLNFSIVFVLVLGTFLELYYGLFKIAIEQFTIKYRIRREDAHRRELQDLVGSKSKDLMNEGLADFNIEGMKKSDESNKPKREDIDPNLFKL